MIDFACKQFKLNDVVKCALGLSKGDQKVMEFFIKNSDNDYTTEKLAKALRINLTTAQRAVKKLSEKGIIKRKQQNLENGGYLYNYSLQDKRIIREIIITIIKSWVKKVEEGLEKW